MAKHDQSSQVPTTIDLQEALEDKIFVADLLHVELDVQDKFQDKNAQACMETPRKAWKTLLCPDCSQRMEFL